MASRPVDRDVAVPSPAPPSPRRPAGVGLRRADGAEPAPSASPAPPRPRLVLGVDPGTLRVGWAVVSKSGNTFRALAFGVIRARGPLAGRLLQIYDALTAIAHEHRPDVLALEDVFYGKDIRAMEKIGEGRAIAKLVAAQCGMPVSEYPPATVKKSVAGHGGASKEAVSRMIMAAFRLSEAPKPADVSDALALGLCHCTRGADELVSPRRATRRRGWTMEDLRRLAPRSESLHTRGG